MLTKGRNVSAVICHRKACKSTLTVAWSCARERGQTWRRRPRAGLWRNRAVGLRKDEHKAQWMYCQCPSGIQSEEIEENSLGIQCSWRFSVFLALACECDITVPVVPCGTVVWASWPVLPHVCTGSSVRVRSRLSVTAHRGVRAAASSAQLSMVPLHFRSIQLPTVPALFRCSVFVWNPFPSMCTCNQRRLLSAFGPLFQNDFQQQWISSESS